jgi:hypothetical protein
MIQLTDPFDGAQVARDREDVRNSTVGDHVVVSITNRLDARACLLVRHIDSEAGPAGPVVWSEGDAQVADVSDPELAWVTVPWGFCWARHPADAHTAARSS